MIKKALFNFVILCLCAIFLIIFHQSILNLELLEINSFSKIFSEVQIKRILILNESNEFYNYTIVLLNIFLKVFLTALILMAGSVFVEIKIKFLEILNISIKAEFIFLMPILYEVLYFKIIDTEYTFNDIQYFYPLSALNIIGYENLEPWYIYPLQTLNLFELGYWLFLGYLIGKETATNMDTGFKIVAASYGPALLLWVVTIMFFNLNNS